MNDLDRFLINTICAMHDPIAALADEPTTPEDFFLAERIKNVLGRTEFTDSTIDDLLQLAHENAPIALCANRDYNFTPTNSTILDIDRDHAAIVDYCLN